jgi:transposase
MDVVKRANALLSVRAGKSYIEAAKVAGYKSKDTISRLVSRFNQRGLVALSIAVGRGRKPTYTSAQQTRILAEVQRKPDHKEDQTGIWSLMTLRRALRKNGLPHVGALHHSSGPPCVRISLPTNSHMVPNRLRTTCAEKRDRDRV